MAAITICSDFEAPKNKVWHCSHCLPIYFPWTDRTRCHDLSLLNVKLWANFFTLLFHFQQEAFYFLFTFCHKGGVICISEVIDISPGNLESTCASSSPAFLMMYSVYKLKKQGDNIQPWRTPFPIWNQSVVACSVLTVASWPAYRFPRSRSGGLVFPSLSEFSTVYCDPHSQRLWCSQKAEIEIDVFLELSCLFDDPVDVGGLRGATSRSRSGGVAMRRYPSPKVRSRGCALLEQQWRDTPCPR